MFLHRLITTLSIISFAIALSAQAPQAFSFQGVAYDENSEPITDQEINVRIEILTDPISTISIYSEGHEIITSPSGLFSLEIGRGDIISGVFSDITWGSSSHFIKVGIDVEGNGDFAVMGITELLSVPYALYAENTNLAPQFYVGYYALRGPNTDKRIKDKIGTLFAQTFEFHWIDGNLEDVFVDYKGIPEGLCLEQYLLNGAQRLNKNIILSEVDTVYSGVLNPWTKLTLCEEGIYPEVGFYKIDQYFRTGNTTHDSLHFFLEIFENDQDACFPDGPVTYNYTETTCDSIPDNLVASIVIEPINEDLILIPAPIDSLSAEMSNYSFPNCFSSIYLDWNNLEYDAGTDYDVRLDIRLHSSSDESLTFTFSSSWTNEYGQPFDEGCNVKYERVE